MESHLFEIDLLTALEPRNCKSLEINETISRFMESALFEIDLLTGLEPRNCKSLEINETISRFMESSLFEIDLLTALEPGIPGGETPPSTAGGTPAATAERFMGRPGRPPLRTPAEASGVPGFLLD